MAMIARNQMSERYAMPPGHPQPSAETPDLPEPRDVDFPGTIGLRVDATDVTRRIFQVSETIPVQAAGPMVLFFPKWLPGYHSPRSPIELFAGLEIMAGDARLAWRRDPVEVYAFHLEVPEGAQSLEIRFQFLSPTASNQGDVAMTPQMLNLHWNTVVLYPAGYYARRIAVDAEVTLPQGWSLACALEQARSDGATTAFATTQLDTLLDSPLFAGRHFRSVDLDEGGAVRLNLFGDRADLIEATDDQIAPHRRLVAEVDALFGARHFDHYDFLAAVSDQLGGGGIERHRSAELVLPADYFTQWDNNLPKRDVFGHEYIHSWNGKYRRGADNWTPSFDVPIRNSLMWVYEGLTQYWGEVLATRSGLWTQDTALQSLARTAAIYANREGGVWRPLSDTTRDPVINGRSPQPWPSWQRSEDYYSEGALVWLSIDTLIRELSGDERSLDDFARAFFGMNDGEMETSLYTFDDVVETLNGIVAHDWKGFLIDRLETREAGTSLDGLERGGYALVYRDTPSEFALKEDALNGAVNLRFSVGLTVGTTGVIQEVLWEAPAFHAGLTTAAEIIAVNGRTFTAEELKQAISDSGEGGPLELLVKQAGETRTVRIDYSGGHRYPHLERIEGARPRLDEIYAPRAAR
jgi:predicted metalloprotease with PDZ domain